MKTEKLKAIIFDMDGTLVDNIPYHKEAWFTMLGKHGISLNPEEFDAQNHGNINDMIRRFFGNGLADEQVVKLGQEKEQTYRDLYGRHLTEVEGLTSMLRALRQAGIKIGLATMGDTPNIDFVLDGLNIRQYFQAVTDGHEIEKGKPHPDIFNLSLQKLGMNANECLVVEDSMGGIEAARAAGIPVVGITTSHAASEFPENVCLATVSNYLDLCRLLRLNGDEKACV